MPGLDFLKRDKIWLACIGCLGLGGMILFDRTRAPAPPPIVWEEKSLPAPKTPKAPDAPTPPALTSVTIDVDGAVRKPGVYTLAAGSRLQDALKAAGGAWSNADLSAYNRAALLKDGTKITVPKLEAATVAMAVPSGRPSGRVASQRPPRLPGRLGGGAPAAIPEEYKADDTTYRVEPLRPPDPPSTPAASASEKPKSKARSSGKKEAHAVNVNTANAEELCGLPGVGPSTAAAIVAYREVNGPFTSVEALDGVKGIGPKKLEAMRAYVRL